MILPAIDGVLGCLNIGAGVVDVRGHTHVTTGDERVLPAGTAFLTDVGMTGPYESVIGMRTDKVLHRFLHQTPRGFEVAKGDLRLAAVQIDIDETTGQARGVERLLISDAQL